MSFLLVVFIFSFIQLFAILIFFWRRGLSVLDVPSEARKQLLSLCLIHLIGTSLFLLSLQHLSPVVAVLAMHTGLVALTCIFRIVALQQLFFSVTIGKIKGVIILLMFGAIPGLTVVDMDQFNEKFTMREYWVSLVFAIVCGLLLAVKTKLTHALCRHSPLRHEAYLSLYASLTVCVALPAFIGVQSIGRKRQVLDQE